MRNLDFAGRRIGQLRALVRVLVAVPMLPLLVLAAGAARLDTARRRRSGARPRLIWGPVPIISIKYWSEALRARGYRSRTCVFEHYAMHERIDFDTYFDEFMPAGIVFDPLRAYAVFLWVLRTADVYLCFLDGGFLQGTALRRLDLPLLRLAGKRVVVSPYGSDIAVRGSLGPFERPAFEDYPELARNAERIRARVLEFSRWANLVVRNYQPGFLPHWDIFWPTQLGIDTEVWSPAASPSRADGHNGEVVVVHAPNHRRLKGTDLLVDAVERLKGDGLRVRLELLERRANAEVHTAVICSDIVADQFVAGYGLFAVEGMAAARPVLSALGWMPSDLRENHEAHGLPIVDTDRDGLLDSLRSLIEDPERRKVLGEAGRRFVLEHHSYEAVGATFDAIIRHVWSGTPLPDDLLPAPSENRESPRHVRAGHGRLHTSSHAP